MNDSTINELAQRLSIYNQAYRRGDPMVPDAEYDLLVERLRALSPDHPYLSAVEPEQFSGRRQVSHPTPMLSIEKAYTGEQLERFVERVNKAAQRIDGAAASFRLMPKLDGLAGRDDGEIFATRGDGQKGYEISSAFAKGVIPIGGRGQGTGEIVVVKSYFDEKMSRFFEHPRNMVVGIVTSDILNENAKVALADGMVHFIPYNQIDSKTVDGTRLIQERQTLVQDLLATVDYPTDGVVAEVIDERIKSAMGATTHHYRWQIAIKTKGETAETTVIGIQWQVGRTGNVTPVMEVDPVPLSGATIRRVTAHHAGNIRNLAIGVGTRIEVIRSGEVIPKLENIIEPAGDVRLPDHCPSCDQQLMWENDFLRCKNPQCRAQIEQGMVHWFRILGNADWFGPRTIEKIVENGHRDLAALYGLGQEDFEGMGFGPVQSKNLADALSQSLTRPVDDWRFLAAFGIANLGVGDSRKLLTHVAVEDVLSLTQDQIKAIKGFGEITSSSIVADLARIGPLVSHMLALGFNLHRTPLVTEASTTDSPIAGKGIVFTGKMVHGSRQAMQAEAAALGARVQTAVSGATDYLVCGENVGATKKTKAEKLGVTLITEEQYRAMIDQGDRM